MAEGKKRPKGVSGFQRRDGAPDFVVGTLIIEPRELVDWLSTPEGRESLTEYNGKKQLKLQILKAQTGLFLNFQVDTWNKGQSSPPKQERGASYDDSQDAPF